MLIVKDSKKIPFTFESQSNMVRNFIRVVPVYKASDSYDIPVVPCHNHANSKQGTSTNTCFVTACYSLSVITRAIFLDLKNIEN